MFTTRPELVGTHGMVASTHWLVSSAGMAVLESGGNAFDAAVAAGLTLQVDEPHLDGPGGEVPIIFHSAESAQTLVIGGQGPAPAAASPKPGTLFSNPDLASTFRRIVEEAESRSADREGQIEAAHDAFYRGFVAEAIEQYVTSTQVMDTSGRRHGGLLSGDDFAAQQGRIGRTGNAGLPRLHGVQDRAVGALEKELLAHLRSGRTMRHSRKASTAKSWTPGPTTRKKVCKK